MSVSSDIWALACTLFEIRAGCQLFASFFGDKDEIIRQIVQTFGKLPEPWWSGWDHRPMFFGDNGKPNEKWPNDIALAVQYPLDAQIRDIGADDKTETSTEAEMTPIGGESTHSHSRLGSSSIIEASGCRVSRAEADDLEDLLRKMLQFEPRDRISVEEALKHQWLTTAY